MSRNYDRPRVDEQWAATRGTCVAVATAIHAIANSKRSADAIWEAPTQAEEDHVKMAVQEYLDHGDFQRDPDGKYQWGVSALTIESKAPSSRIFDTYEEAQAYLDELRAKNPDGDSELIKIAYGKYEVRSS